MNEKELWIKLSEIDEKHIANDVLTYYFNPPIHEWETAIKDFYKKTGNLLTNQELDRLIKKKVEERLQHTTSMSAKFFTKIYVKREEWLPYLTYCIIGCLMLMCCLQIGFYCKDRYDDNYLKSQLNADKQQMANANLILQRWENDKPVYTNYDGVLKNYLSNEVEKLDKKFSYFKRTLEKDEDTISTINKIDDLNDFINLQDQEPLQNEMDLNNSLIEIEKTGTNLIKETKTESVELDSAIENLRNTLEQGDLNGSQNNLKKLEDIIHGAQKVFLWSDTAKTWYNKLMFSDPDLPSKKIINDLYDKINLSAQQEVINNDLSDLLFQYANIFEQKITFKVVEDNNVPVGFVRNNTYYIVLQAFDEKNKPISIPVSVESGYKQLNVFGLVIDQNQYEKLKTAYVNQTLKNKIYGYKNKKSLVYNFNIENSNVYTEYIPSKS